MLHFSYRKLTEFFLLISGVRAGDIGGVMVCSAKIMFFNASIPPGCCLPVKDGSS